MIARPNLSSLLHLTATIFTAAALVTSVGAQSTTGLKMDNQAAFLSGLRPRLEMPHHDSLVPRSGITLEAWFTYDETTMKTGGGFRAHPALQPCAAIGRIRDGPSA